MHPQRVHIAHNKKNLILRAHIIKTMREYFWETGCIEIDAPSLIALPGQEPNIEPIPLTVHTHEKNALPVFLHTSPEYVMKKALSVDIGDCFYLGAAYRNYESLGGLHHPEFTMLEWYRTQTDYHAIMEDIAQLLQKISHTLTQAGHTLPNIFTTPPVQISVSQLFETYLGVSDNAYLNIPQLQQLCQEKNIHFETSDRYEELFYRLFLIYIEPHLGIDAPMIVHSYPAQMASLARLNPEDPRFAERFELYINGIEIANCFTELTNGAEQQARLTAEAQTRTAQGSITYPIDLAFIEAVNELLPCSGIALGIDRLIMLLLGCKNIRDVLVLPLSQE